jgi:hypothetical protein
MGKHQNAAGLKIFTFLEELGDVLGYYVNKEEWLFRSCRGHC